MRIDETIRYWKETSDYDFSTAEAMLKTGRFLYVGFMAHQAIEKALKALHWHNTRSDPPYTHDLWRLCERAGFAKDLPKAYRDLVDELQPLNVETR